MHYEHGSAFMKSWFTQLCEEFFSSFFYMGAWKGDRKIFLAVFYSIYVVSLEKFHEEDYHPSVLLHCWLGHLTCKIVSEMTYNVSSGTLNPTIQWYTTKTVSVVARPC